MRRNSWWGADEHGEFVVSDDGNQTLCEGSGSESSEFVDMMDTYVVESNQVSLTKLATNHVAKS